MTAVGWGRAETRIWGATGWRCGNGGTAGHSQEWLCYRLLSVDRPLDFARDTDVLRSGPVSGLRWFG
jgi:hypothetical protein